MIKVVFKKEKEKGFGETEFTYKDYLNAEVGDIVVVDTRYGYAIAMITAINIRDDRFLENNLKEVVCTIETKKERDEKIAKEKMIQQLAIDIKKENILKELRNIIPLEHIELIETMKYDELVEFYEAIKN